MERTKSNHCTGMDERLAELLLDPGAEPVAVRKHVEECDRCSRELEELRTTMALLEVWEAPEPNPYFLSRLDERMRDVRSTEPTGWLSGWFNRLRAGFAYGGGISRRPLRGRPPWCMTCRRWTATPNCWINWRRSPITTTRTRTKNSRELEFGAPFLMLLPLRLAKRGKKARAE